MDKFDTVSHEVLRKEIKIANALGLNGRKITVIDIVQNTDATARDEAYCIFNTIEV